MRFLFGFILIAITALAADYSGTYQAEVESSSGKIQNILVLKIAGDKLTGTITNQFGTMPIQDGSAEGENLFFVVMVKDEGDPFRMVYRGHAFNDEIQFRIEAGERQIEMVAKKK